MFEDLQFSATAVLHEQKTAFKEIRHKTVERVAEANLPRHRVNFVSSATARWFPKKNSLCWRAAICEPKDRRSRGFTRSVWRATFSARLNATADSSFKRRWNLLIKKTAVQSFISSRKDAVSASSTKSALMRCKTQGRIRLRQIKSVAERTI